MFHALFPRFRRPADNHRSSRRSRTRIAAIRFEPLEQRRLLAVLTVDDSGGADFTSIAGAVAAASAGDEIVVAEGTYNENVTIDKRLTLRGAHEGDAGEDRDLVNLSDESVINGSLVIAASGVTIDGFLIQGSAAAGISTQSTFSGHTIQNNILRNNVIGLSLESEGTDETLVAGNWFVNNNASGAASGNGIYSDAQLQNARIESNLFQDHNNAGITLAPSPGTHFEIEIADNKFINDSVFFINVTDIEVTGNTFRDTDFSAVNPSGGNNLVLIADNTFIDPEVRAIHVLDQGFNASPSPNRNVTIRDNDIQYDVSALFVDGNARAAIDVDGLTGASVISGNEITLSGTLPGGVPAHYGIRVTGDATQNVTISDNTVTGGNVDANASDEASAGILIGGTLPVSANVEVADNTVSGFLDGIRILAQAVLTGNVVAGNQVGVNVDGGTALLQNNNLNGAALVGLLIQNGAVVDAGQTSGQAGGTDDYTGLGISSGGNDFSGYVVGGTALAIENRNSDPGTDLAFPPDVRARNNVFVSTDLSDIEQVVRHEIDDPALAFVDFGDPALPNVDPDADDDTATTVKNQSVTIDVLSNDSDDNDDELTVTAVTQPDDDVGTVTINDDGTITFTPATGFVGTATFTYTVSDGRGGTDTATVTVTVTATAPPPGGGQFPSDPDDVPHGCTNEDFVRNLFEDLLDRDADQGGFNHFFNRLNNGVATREETIQDLLNSREYLGNLVTEMFQEFLGRDPEQAALNHFVNSLRQGAREEAVIAAILSSDEYFQVQGGTNEQFVRGLYEDLLGRDPTQGEVGFWVQTMAGGQTRVQVVNSFTTSQEFRRLLVDDPEGRFLVMEGWRQDYLGDVDGAPAADVFFAQLESGRAWRDVQTAMLSEELYFCEHEDGDSDGDSDGGTDGGGDNGGTDGGTDGGGDDNGGTDGGTDGGGDDGGGSDGGTDGGTDGGSD